ncbi:MAG TPA: extracellular solute-binding protein [Acidothermaceae bacterium]
MAKDIAKIRMLAAGTVVLAVLVTACSSSKSTSPGAASGSPSAPVAGASGASTPAGGVSTPAGGASTPAGSGGSASATTNANPVTLQLMFGSSGDAETNAVNDAAAAWSKKTGNKVTVIPAQNFSQQLTQSLAGGSPPDVFYVGSQQLSTLADNNNLAQTGDKVASPSDFYPSLVQSFTYKGNLMCAPKDFSTLALEINTDMWKAAGLTDADIPTTWDQLETVAKKLTTGGVTGLVFNDTLDRVDAFMRQAGGTMMNAGNTAFTIDTPQNLQGLQFVQKLAKEGVLKFPKQVGTGWGGEAMGTNKAAMAIEGNWFVGGVKASWPNLKYMVVPLPAGPTGIKATLSFTNCWGVAAKSKNQAAAIDFINFLTSDAQQMTFATDFGVMPSRTTDQAAFASAFPDQKAFIDGASYAFGPVGVTGFAAAQTAFDAQVIGLSNGSSDPKTMLAALQKNATDAMNGN